MKTVKKIEDLVKDKRFKFPNIYGDTRYEGKLCIHLQIGGKHIFIPTGEYFPITYQTYCLLKDIGKIKDGDHFEEGEEFNPWREGF